MKRTRSNLLTGGVYRTILTMAGGMVFGLLAMSAFNATDTYFVGQLGAIDLAAMSYTFPVVMIINSVSLGLGTGLSSTVSRAIGKGNHHKVQRLTTDGLLLSVVIVALLAGAGLLTVHPLFRALGASGETLVRIEQYMRIWYIGTPFVIIPMAGNNVIRATGDTLTPSLIMIVSVVINIILDPLLIFGIGPFPQMGIAGAALATVFARFTTFLFSLYILSFREKLLIFERLRRKATLASWKEIAFVGVPAGLVQAINPLSLSIITRILSRYGDETVAGFGAAGRIEMLIMIVPMTLSTVLAPFTGQNWGAKNYERIRKAIRFTCTISIGWGLLIFTLFLFFAHPIVRVFNGNADIIQAGAAYLQIAGISYGFLGVLMLVSQSFNAMNKPLHGAFITLTKAFVLNVPLALLGSYLWGIRGVYSAAFIANTLSGILALLLVSSVMKKQLNTGELPQTGGMVTAEKR